MNTDDPSLNKLSERIIGCGFTVSNALGVGFLEKVYENALAHELRKAGLGIQQQYAMAVRYDGIIVGEYIADFLVERLILVELKVVKALDGIHIAQCMNYLRATGLRLCLLMNFARPRVEIKRIAL